MLFVIKYYNLKLDYVHKNIKLFFFLFVQIKEIKNETVTNPVGVKQEVIVVKEEIIDDQSPSTSSSTQTPTNNSNTNHKFKPHNYGNTNFSKYHNQSKDVLYIAKRLQKVIIFPGLII